MKILSLPFLVGGLATLAVAGGLIALTVHTAPMGAKSAVAMNAPGQASTPGTAPMVQAPSTDASAMAATAPSPGVPSAAAPSEAPSTPGDNGTGAPGERHRERMQQIFAQLGLTDEQKQQIQQIRQTVTDRQQRREQIMNILTPDQRAKLLQLRAQRGNGGAAAPGNESTPAPAPTPPASS